MGIFDNITEIPEDGLLRGREGSEVDVPMVTTDDLVNKTLHGETAIVAPSAGIGYNSVQAAIDDGKRHIQVAEDISENNIQIPTVGLDVGFLLESLGSRSTITDPDNNGTPIMEPADKTANSLNVKIRDLDFAGASGSGPLLDANFRENGGTAHRWELSRLRAKDTGPLILAGVDEPTIRHVSVTTSTTATFTFNATDYTVGAGLVLEGENVDLVGGDYGNGSNGGEYGLLIVSTKRLTQYGATDVDHEDNGTTAVAAWGLDTVSNATFINPVVEGPGSSAPADMEFNNTITGNNYGEVDIFEPYCTHGKLIVDGGDDIDFYKPGGASGTLEVTGAADIVLQEGTTTWTLAGNNPDNGLIYAGATSRQGPNGGGTEELKNGRYLVQESGSASNPAYHIGSNGAGIFLNGSGEVVVVDEAGNTTTLS